MNGVSKHGAIAGGIVWFVLIVWSAFSSACIKSRSCDGGDFILFAIVVAGYFLTAYLVATIWTKLERGEL